MKYSFFLCYIIERFSLFLYPLLNVIRKVFRGHQLGGTLKCSPYRKMNGSGAV